MFEPPGGIAASLRTVATRLGTPVYALERAALRDAAARLAAAFPDPWQRRYSLKANDEPGVVRELAALGMGANVVSQGEWRLATAAGIPNADITLEGIGKTDADLRAAVRAAATGRPLAWVAVETAEELSALGDFATGAGLGRGGRPPLEILLRLNPDVAPETHHGLAVGRGSSKFGLSETELTALVGEAAAIPALRPRGVQVHVGSQLAAVDAWREAVRLALAIVALVRGGLDAFDTLDVGGGFPVAPRGAAVPGPEVFANHVPALVEAVPPDRRPRRWAVEPGRFLVARAGWLVASVLHVRERGDERVVVLDAGMAELIRPALYGAVHPVVALTSGGRVIGDQWLGGTSGTAERPEGSAWTAGGDDVRVDGPVCESTDTLGVHHLPPLVRGDLVAIGDAGAYADSMAATYNGRPRAPVVLIGPDGGVERVRRRGRAG